MRSRNGRLFAAGLAASLVLVCAGAAAAQSTQVETFTSGGLINFTMPGIPSLTGGTNFSASLQLQSLDFSPGSLGFNGTPVDFDGTEPQFLGCTYAAQPVFPVQTGPANVPVSGLATAVGGPIRGGTGGGGGGGCMVTDPHVNVGPTFAPNRLDLVAGPGNTISVAIPTWNTSNVTQLNHHYVTLENTFAINAVDPVNGIVNFTAAGVIFAGNNVVPALTTVGLIALAIGLFGMAVLAVSRRGRVQRAG